MPRQDPRIPQPLRGLVFDIGRERWAGGGPPPLPQEPVVATSCESTEVAANQVLPCRVVTAELSLGAYTACLLVLGDVVPRVPVLGRQFGRQTPLQAMRPMHYLHSMHTDGEPGIPTG